MDEEPDVCLRLYRSSRRTVKREKTANDALISDLPTTTLKWIKNRRKLDSTAKMVLSHNRERQLRDIFNGIDVGKHGSIHLIELNEAVKYVSERMKNRLGSFVGFDKIMDIFHSMDDNGDGVVDFQEFTNAMTGSSKSALDKASEQDIENLHRCFLEFGVMKSRRFAIAKINEYTGLSFAGEHILNKQLKLNNKEQQFNRKNSETTNITTTTATTAVNDLKSYQLFRTLFEENRDFNAKNVQGSNEGMVIEEECRISKEELLLKEFQEENRRNHLAGCEDVEKQKEYDAVHERLKQARLREAELLARDPDSLLMKARQEEATKYFSERRKQMHTHAKSNPHLKTADGKPIPNSLGPEVNTIVPPASTIAIKAAELAAKKDAYEILRKLKYMSPMERARRRSIMAVSIAQTVDLRAAAAAAMQAVTELELAQSNADSSVDGSRHSSNLPTTRSRSARHRSALHRSQSLEAFITSKNHPRPSTAPTAVTLTATTSTKIPNNTMATTASTSAGAEINNVPSSLLRNKPGMRRTNGRPSAARPEVVAAITVPSSFRIKSGCYARPGTADSALQQQKRSSLLPRCKSASGSRLRLRSPLHMQREMG